MLDNIVLALTAGFPKRVANVSLSFACLHSRSSQEAQRCGHTAQKTGNNIVDRSAAIDRGM